MSSYIGLGILQLVEIWFILYKALFFFSAQLSSIDSIDIPKFWL